MKHKAPGPNKLTANQLKNLSPNMTNFLTEIFNHSLSAGYFPNSYKHAFLEENNLQNERQHGFRRNRGTQTAILTLHETISKHLSLKHKVDIAWRDVTKAFDKIWHTGLKYKITELGKHSATISLIERHQ